MIEFFRILTKQGLIVFNIAINHDLFSGFVVSLLSIIWIFSTIIIALGFNGIQKAGFESNGEKVEIDNTTNDSGATFLVIYVLPLLTDDVSSFRGLIVFLTMLIMVIMILSRSNTPSTCSYEISNFFV